jgi:hypothetical protein
LAHVQKNQKEFQSGKQHENTGIFVERTHQKQKKRQGEMLGYF